MWLAAKPNLRAASCCSVEVVNGGGGLRVNGLVSTDWTVKRPSSTTFLAAVALPSSPIDKRSILLPSSATSRAENGVPSASKLATTDQYSRALNSSISRSRSTIRRSATDWTRPADLAPGSLRHRIGESVNPTR